MMRNAWLSLCCSLLALSCALIVAHDAKSLVVDTGTPAHGDLEVTTFDPAASPLRRISVTLDFSNANPLDPGETVLVRAYNSANTAVGESQYTNNFGIPIYTCACFSIDVQPEITDATYSIELVSLTGSIDVTSASAVSYAAPGPARKRESESFAVLTGPVFDPNQPAEPSLVYVRQPRNQNSQMLNGQQIDDASNAQIVNDVGTMWRQTESDIVIDDLAGNITVIHNCTNSPDMCTAQEPRVSPDGTKIAYAVSTPGPANNQVTLYGTDVWGFDTHAAHIWIYEVDTGNNYPVTTVGKNRTPDWASNDLLVWASDRAGTFSPMSGTIQFPTNFYDFPALQIYRGRLVGQSLTEITNISPAEYHAFSPEVLSTGEVCYSAYQGPYPRYFGTTPQNHWWVQCVDINGSDFIVELGAHGTNGIKMWEHVSSWMDPARRGEGSTTMKALRPVTEIAPGLLAADSYYRTNHLGANGSIIQWGFNPEHEGVLTASDAPEIAIGSTTPGSGRYVPSDMINLTPWAQDQDMSAPKFHLDGRSTGKAGYPSSWPGDTDEWLYSHLRGDCYIGAVVGAGLHRSTYAYQGGEPPCKKQINLAKVAQTTNPFDTDQTECIAACELQWNAWDAHVIAPYSTMFNVAAPQIKAIEPPASSCFLNVVNARNMEGLPIPNKTSEQDRIDFQGNIDSDYPATVTHFGVEMFDHHTSLPVDVGLATSNAPIMEPLEADGSVRLEIPCNEPFLHFGFNADGDIIASGIAPMSTPNELTCHGCHDGHSETRSAQIGATAKSLFPNTDAAPAP